MTPRLPITLFCAAAAYFLLPLPYVYFNSDSAMAAFMGADILEHGYAPTYFYGQSYFLSFTPYLFAIVKWAFGWIGFGDVALFKATGLAVSFAGLWLLYETALLQAGTRNEALRAGALFILIFASFPSAILRMYDASQAEQYYFCFGLVIYSMARLQRALDQKGPDPYGLWALLGAALFYGLHSRPQAVIYGFFGIIAIFLSLKKRPDARAVFSFGAGAVAGSSLYLLHLAIRRGDWPFSSGGPSRALGDSGKIFAQLETTLGGIIPHLFEWSSDQPVRSALSLLLVILALYAGAAFYALPFLKRSLGVAADSLRRAPGSMRLGLAALFGLIGIIHALGLIYLLAIGPFDGSVLGLHITLSDPAKPLLIASAFAILAILLAWPPEISAQPRAILSSAEISLFCGSLALILLLIFIKDLGGDIGSARYAAVFPAVTALMIARWALTILPSRRMALLAMALFLFLLSIPQWGAMLEWESRRNAEFAADLEAIRSLKEKTPLLWADYWDAYALAFAGGERPLLEVYPFQKARRYGRVSREVARQGLWLARESDLDKLAAEARSAAGSSSYQAIQRLVLRGGVPYLLIKFDDPTAGEKMMDAHHPLYFKTNYPPGS